MTAHSANKTRFREDIPTAMDQLKQTLSLSA